jgi:hypothetical protein
MVGVLWSGSSLGWAVIGRIKVAGCRFARDIDSSPSTLPAASSSLSTISPMPIPPLLLSRPTNLDAPHFLPISIRSSTVLAVELHPIACFDRSLDFLNAGQFDKAVVLVARWVGTDFFAGLVVDAWAWEEKLRDGLDRGLGNGGGSEE